MNSINRLPLRTTSTSSTLLVSSMPPRFSSRTANSISVSSWPHGRKFRPPTRCNTIWTVSVAQLTVLRRKWRPTIFSQLPNATWKARICCTSRWNCPTTFGCCSSSRSSRAIRMRRLVWSHVRSKWRQWCSPLTRQLCDRNNFDSEIHRNVRQHFFTLLFNDSIRYTNIIIH